MKKRRNRTANRMNFIAYILVAFYANLSIAQEKNESAKEKKEIGHQILAINTGVFWQKISNLFDPSQGLTIGIEKRRQRLIMGPTFGNDYFYDEPNKKYELTGFFIDYSFVFFIPLSNSILPYLHNSITIIMIGISIIYHQPKI